MNRRGFFSAMLGGLVGIPAAAMAGGRTERVVIDNPGVSPKVLGTVRIHHPELRVVEFIEIKTNELTEVEITVRPPDRKKIDQAIREIARSEMRDMKRRRLLP